MLQGERPAVPPSSWGGRIHVQAADRELCGHDPRHGVPQAGASLDDGLAAVQAMVAIARSVESGEYVRLDDVSGGV